MLFFYAIMAAAMKAGVKNFIDPLGLLTRRPSTMAENRRFMNFFRCYGQEGSCFDDVIFIWDGLQDHVTQSMSLLGYGIMPRVGASRKSRRQDV